MRRRDLATSVTLAVLACVLLSAVHVMAARKTVRFDGHVYGLDFSESVPGQLNYQGFLVDADDSSAVTADLELIFRLYDSETKGTELWSETHPTVEISNGLFHVLLGSVTPFPSDLFDSSALWLQTEVGTEILAPRKPLASVAYSQRAEDADHASQADIADDADQLEGQTLTDLDSRYVGQEDLDHLNAADGDPAEAVYVDDAGKVGVGTTSPVTELDVNGSVQASAFYGDGSNLTGISGAPDGDWTISGAHMYSAVPGSVGIGTSSPESKLHVAGDVKATTYYGDGSNLTGIIGAADGDWTVSGNVLYPAGDFGLSMCSPNVMYGINDSTHVNFGIACTTGTFGQNYQFCTVGGGRNNTASGFWTTVAGGRYNAAIGNESTVGGGSYNTSAYGGATVSGGVLHQASAYYATVGGGEAHTASGVYSTVGGGSRDTVNAPYGGIAAGYSNLAGEEAADTAAFVGGGYNNSATARYATVAGGRSNTASNDYATVGAGQSNTASGYRATVSGGVYNTASGVCATGGGGYNNTASSNYAAVGGGQDNTASGDYAAVGGGHSNTASGDYAAVGGGHDNTASGSSATVGGGADNSSDGTYSFTVGFFSNVPSSYSNSAAFNGQTATASSQTRVGTLSKTSGTFTIDHPTQPLNRILNHYFVESPEMVLIYRGEAVIGTDGRAEVHLPDYFDTLNRNPMIQLTGVGTSDVYVAEKVTGNRFVIGGKPGTEVYWTVTGDRKDQSAEITRILMPVEQIKEGDLAGHSLDDDFLASAMSQLERMGQAGRFSFRTQAGREKYQRSQQALEDAHHMESGDRD